MALWDRVKEFTLHYGGWIPPSRFCRQVVVIIERLERNKMPLRRNELRVGMPGYYPKNQIRYRFCNNFHDEGLRCTRQMGHPGPHAAHVVMGIENTTEEIKNEQGEVIDVKIKEGMKNTEDVQIATW